MNTIKKNFWDIETRPLPLEELRAFMPTEWPLGNLKDPSKVALAKMEKEAEWIEKAALSAITGSIVCIGIRGGDSFNILHGDGDERQLLEDFWNLWADRTKLWIGFNTHSFDLKFIIRRSLHWGIKLPMRIPTKMWEMENSIDLVDLWKMGDRNDYISLDNLARHLGLPGKKGHGKDFAALWDSDRDAASDYLLQDVRLVEQIAELMGV